MKSNIELNYEAISFRKRFNQDEYSYIDIFEIAKNISNLTIVLYPFSNHISGMCIKNEIANLIAINSSMSIGRQRFSLAHELYHLFYVSNEGITVSNLNYQGDNDTEKEANMFASYLLIPYNSLKDCLNELNNEINETNLIHIEQRFGMSHQALLTRLSIDKLINKNTFNKLQDINLNSICKKLGYDNPLYSNNPKNKLYSTIGNYINQATYLMEKDKISLGKYNEYLTQAYREDLIYNQNTYEVIND